MKILSLITHTHVVPNQYELSSSCEHKLRYFWLNSRAFWLCIDKITNKVAIFVFFAHENYSSSILVALQRLFPEDKQSSYGFAMTLGWIINDRIFISGWTIP